MTEHPYQFTPITVSDGEALIEIFNHYIEESEAAFLEDPVSPVFFEKLLPYLKIYPSVAVRDGQDALVGFGMLRPHNQMPAFRHTAEITYFIRPDLTGQGIGTSMLQHLEEQGKGAGIRNILACISSRNEGSIRFHTRSGFTECGRFKNTGRKKGRFFDTVWMQKEI
ncbi:N-acetyltransferase family protein [Methanosphaerula subterraneus]|uniref:GNAT family N-acetyltransferase n=1 Tax=Methanosphaerula subterraneus TaxID=3350244 RepID=UPI003F82E1CA